MEFPNIPPEFDKYVPKLYEYFVETSLKPCLIAALLIGVGVGLGIAYCIIKLKQIRI